MNRGLAFIFEQREETVSFSSYAGTARPAEKSTKETPERVGGRDSRSLIQSPSHHNPNQY
jgi:hypothetical protein